MSATSAFIMPGIALQPKTHGVEESWRNCTSELNGIGFIRQRADQSMSSSTLIPSFSNGAVAFRIVSFSSFEGLPRDMDITFLLVFTTTKPMVWSSGITVSVLEYFEMNSESTSLAYSDRNSSGRDVMESHNLAISTHIVDVCTSGRLILYITQSVRMSPFRQIRN